MDASGQTVIMDETGFERTLKRISHQIIESVDHLEDIALIGIKRRGVSLAREIAGYIKRFEDVEIPIGVLDITFYRDDTAKRQTEPVINDTKIEFEIDGKKIVLVDDVLYTGRTARAAMDAIMDMGRPALIKYAVLIDRGHRELPIRADFVGKNVPTSKDELILVQVDEFDGKRCVLLSKKGD